MAATTSSPAGSAAKRVGGKPPSTAARLETLLHQHGYVRAEGAKSSVRAQFWRWIAITFAAVAVFGLAYIHAPMVRGTVVPPHASAVQPGLTPAEHKQLADAFKGIDNQFGAIRAEFGKFAELDERLAKFGKALNEVVSTSVDTLKSVDERIAGVNAKLDALKPQPLDTDKVAEQVAAKVTADTVEKSTVLHSELKALSGRVETLAARIETLSAPPAASKGGEVKQEPAPVVTLQPVSPQPPAQEPKAAGETDPKSVSPRKLDFSGDETDWMKLIPRAKFDTIAAACSGTHKAWEYYTPAELKRMLAEVDRRRLTKADAEKMLTTCDPAILLGSVASLSDEEEAKLNQLLARHTGATQR